MLLAGDVGGTKTLLGLYAPQAPRPLPIDVRAYRSNEFASFTAILDAFARDIGQELTPRAAVIGVAGPVFGTHAHLTNIDWDITVAEIASRIGSTRVELMNDLEAMANSIPVLQDQELETLQEGDARSDGNAVVIAAGTGMGQAYLHRVNGRLRPVASEGGHADFAARNEREMELVRQLRDQFGRAEVEQVLSGPGLMNIYRLTHRGSGCPVLEDASLPSGPAQVSQGALAGRCQFCVEALRMFVDAYGAEAGNLALRGVASSGVFVGGGIAPKILPALRDGAFMRPFLSKQPMRELVEKMPVKVILNPDAGLVGASARASEIQGN